MKTKYVLNSQVLLHFLALLLLPKNADSERSSRRVRGHFEEPQGRKADFQDSSWKPWARQVEFEICYKSVKILCKKEGNTKCVGCKISFPNEKLVDIIRCWLLLLVLLNK